MTVSVFDHPFLSGLLGDEEVAGFFSAKADIDAMLAFEAALAEAEAAEGVIPKEAGKAIAAALKGFAPDVAALREGTARDGLPVPSLVRQLRKRVGEPHSESVHFGATSQDVIDTSLALRMVKLLDILGERIDGVIGQLDALMTRDGGSEVMA
ncbi:MAG TPA: lyase family protein, partial [Rhizobiaceae bacterium]|nr:lyase family protein [Rhizobiaceae bacterium]